MSPIMRSFRSGWVGWWVWCCLCVCASGQTTPTTGFRLQTDGQPDYVVGYNKARLVCTYFQPVKVSGSGYVVNGAAYTDAAARLRGPVWRAEVVPGRYTGVRFFSNMASEDLSTPEGDESLHVKMGRHAMGGAPVDSLWIAPAGDPALWRSSDHPNLSYPPYGHCIVPIANGFEIYHNPGWVSAPTHPGATPTGTSFLLYRFILEEDTAEDGGGDMSSVVAAIEAFHADFVAFADDFTFGDWMQAWDSWLHLDEDGWGAWLAEWRGQRDELHQALYGGDGVPGLLADVVSMRASLTAVQGALTAGDTSIATPAQPAVGGWNATVPDGYAPGRMNETYSGAFAEHGIQALDFGDGTPATDAPVWSFEVDTPGFGMFEGQSWDLVVDFEMFEPFRPLVSAFFLMFVSIWGMGLVWDEFRRS